MVTTFLHEMLVDLKSSNVKLSIFMAFFVLILKKGNAQDLIAKPAISVNDYPGWSTLSTYDISSDGNYVWYIFSSEKYGDTLVVKNKNGRLIKKVFNATDAIFLNDNLRLVYKREDTIEILDLLSNSVEILADSVRSVCFSITRNNRLAVSKDCPSDELMILDIDSRYCRKYTDISKFCFSSNGDLVFIQQHNKMMCVDFSNNVKILMTGGEFDNMAFDSSGKNVCFVQKFTDHNNIRQFDSKMDSAKIVVQNSSFVTHSDYLVGNGNLSFSENGKRLCFPVYLNPVGKSALLETKNKKLDGDLTLLVWNYQDKYPQFGSISPITQIAENKYTAILNLESMRILLIENPDQAIAPGKYSFSNNYIIVKDDFDTYDKFITYKKLENIYLISLLDGKRKKLAVNNIGPISDVSISSDERFVVWFDGGAQSYYSFEIENEVIRCITAKIKVPLNDDKAHRVYDRFKPFGTAGWIKDRNSLIIYDRFDLWEVDPAGVKTPKSLTKGYGRSHKVVFRRAESNPEVENADTIIVAAFDTKNKHNGFWRIVGKNEHKLIVGTMMPCVFYLPSMSPSQMISSIQGWAPIKAKKAASYLIVKMTEASSPNLYWTTDFSTVFKISNVEPEVKFNFLTSALVEWKSNGNKISGILYKPENFNSSKNYPMIIHYYEKHSDELFVYRKPKLSNDEINIPYYTSNGYIVFVPDIYFENGNPGKSALLSIKGGLKVLKKNNWIDFSKIGLQGHSFGGYETNFLITHSKIFAAAQEGAGPSNLVSMYGSSKSGIYNSEIGQINMRGTPWSETSRYIRNSPIFNIQNVNTPLLILHNEADPVVPFSQARELYFSLRRLQKPVWLLSYEKQGHSLIDYACVLDFTNKQKDFFDYYLMGFPRPKWMIVSDKQKKGDDVPKSDTFDQRPKQ